MAKTATKGTVVKHGAAASPTTVLANLTNARITPGSRDMIKTTDHAATSTDSYLARPLRDTALLELDILWDPDDAGHEAIRAAFAAGTKYYFSLIAPNTGAAQFDLAGYITDFTPGDFDAEQGLMKANIKYKADSVETFTQ